MPSVAFVKASYLRAIIKAGKSVTIRRGATTATVRGRIWKPKADQASDTVPMPKPTAILLAADFVATGFPVPPKESDFVTAGGRDYAIEHVDDVTRDVAGTIIAYELTLAG